MCDEVIIHKKDGTEITCEDQKDLMREMPEALVFEPPVDPAQLWDYYMGDGIRMTWVYQREGKIGVANIREYYQKEVLDPPYPFFFVPVFQTPLDFHDPLGDLEDGYEPEICLCPVDLEKTAAMNGYRYSKIDPSGEWDPFDTHFYQN